VEEGVLAKDEINDRPNSDATELGSAAAEAPHSAFAASSALWFSDPADDISVND
jgi:hypothetical protein